MGRRTTRSTTNARPTITTPVRNIATNAGIPGRALSNANGTVPVIRPTSVIAASSANTPCAKLNTEEALKIARNSKYGLHASVFSQDINEAFHMAKSLPCGTISINTFSEGDIKTPFGGYKQSGSLSRDQGTEALNQYLQTKTIWISH